MSESSIEIERILLERYSVDPPVVNMTIKNVNEIYKLCEEAQCAKWSSSELCLNGSTFLLGVDSLISTILNSESVPILCIVIGLFVFAIILYLAYLHYRNEDAQQIKTLSNEIIRLMPVSKETVERETANAVRLNNLKVKIFEEHLKLPTDDSHEVRREE